MTGPWSMRLIATLGVLGMGVGPTVAMAAAPADRHHVTISDAPYRTFGRSVTAQFYVAAPPKAVFEVLTDYAHMTEFMPMVDTVRVLKAWPNGAHVSFRVRYLNLFDIVEVDERHYEGIERITWRAVQGPLKVSDGSWTLAPRGPGTNVVYRTEVDPGIPLPSRLTGMLIQSGLPEFLDGVARRVESGGRWRKPR